MSNVEQQSSLPLGLDVGTSRIVVARSMDKSDQTQYESQLNAFITMPYSKLAESLLAREGVFHEVFDGELVVTGNDAQRFAEVFHAEPRHRLSSMLMGQGNSGRDGRGKVYLCQAASYGRLVSWCLVPVAEHDFSCCG